MTTRRLFCFGHRGACGHAPENTLGSVRRALELGADGVEVDVHFAGGQLVVIHDDTLDRTTNGHGRVEDQSFAHLRSLDAGGGEPLPTLAEIFDAVARRAVVNVELKGPHTAAPVAALIAHDIAERGGGIDDFLVSSFNPARIREARKYYPGLRTGLLSARAPRGLVRLAVESLAGGLHVDKGCVTQELVVEAHRHGLRLLAYTVNDPGEIAALRALGVDGVFSDFPERVNG